MAKRASCGLHGVGLPGGYANDRCSEQESNSPDGELGIPAD